MSQDESFHLSKTKVATLGLWASSVALLTAGAFMPTIRLVVIFSTTAILFCGLAAAWTVRCFMRKFWSQLENAYNLGYDKGRQEARDIPPQRVTPLRQE